MKSQSEVAFTEKLVLIISEKKPETDEIFICTIIYGGLRVK